MFTPDGRRLLYRKSPETRYSVLDTTTGKRVNEFAEICGPDILFNFSPDGKTVRALGNGTPPSILRVLDGKAVGQPDMVSGSSLVLNLSPDRTKQLFLESDGTVQLRDPVTFQLLNSVKIELPCKYSRFDCRVQDLNRGVTADGKFAVLTTHDVDGYVIIVRFPDLPASKP